MIILIFMEKHGETGIFFFSGILWSIDSQKKECIFSTSAKSIKSLINCPHEMARKTNNYSEKKGIKYLDFHVQDEK